jgi:hypothetical protein
MANQDFTLRWYKMTIEGLDGKFVVCKLRRVSSPPVLVGSVSNTVESSFQRLADIIRLGKQSRNYADLKAIEWALAPEFMVSTEHEWGEYEKSICRSLGVDRLEPLLPTTAPTSRTRLLTQAVIFHDATMNDRPYLIGRIGTVLGSPAPVFLTWGHERESALERLRDVFRIGVRGQWFKDFVEEGRKQGMSEAEIVKEWRECGRAAMGASG